MWKGRCACEGKVWKGRCACEGKVWKGRCACEGRCAGVEGKVCMWRGGVEVWMERCACGGDGTVVLEGKRVK